MSANDNVKTIQSIYEAFGRGDLVQLAGATELEEFTPLEMIGDGDTVLTVVRYRVKSRTTGRVAEMLLHHYWKFRDGKIAYYRGAEDTLLTLRTVTD